MEPGLFGYEVPSLLFAAFIAWWWSDSLLGFIFFFCLFVSCFGVTVNTEVGQKAIEKAKETVEVVINPQELETPLAELKEFKEPTLTPVPQETPDFGGNADFGAADFGAP